MGDFDASQLPDVPNVQLPEPQLQVPGFQPSAVNFGLPQLHLDPSLGASPSGATADGSSPSPSLLPNPLDYMADHPAGPMAPTGTPLPEGPGPAPPQPLITGDDFIRSHLGGVLNPWAADPQGTAENAERERQMFAPTDPGVDQQQHIIHSPTFRF